MMKKGSLSRNGIRDFLGLRVQMNERIYLAKPTLEPSVSIVICMYELRHHIPATHGLSMHMNR